MQGKTIAQTFAVTLDAMRTCEARNNKEWAQRHKETIRSLCREVMPSGAGWDTGTAFDFDRSTPDKLVFRGEYHHMDDGGYTGWTQHSVTVRPSLVFGLDIRISGRDRNDIKEYLHQTFSGVLGDELSPAQKALIYPEAKTA